jgi:hypothetical protein
MLSTLLSAVGLSTYFFERHSVFFSPEVRKRSPVEELSVVVGSSLIGFVAGEARAGEAK